MTKVLFVDDDENLLASLLRRVRRGRPEWDVRTVTSGAGALDLQDQMGFDVIVTDMSMPGMNGLELVKALNQRPLGPECIVLTGTADLEVAAEIINTARVARFFTKPCPIERLLDGIEDTVRARDLGRQGSVAEGAGDWGGKALNQLAAAIFVVDATARVLHMNHVAAAIIAQRDGLSLDAGGICRASLPLETRSLHELIGKACRVEAPEGGALALSLSRPSHLQALSLVAAPIGTDGPETGQGQTALLLVTDPEKPPSIDPIVIGKLFGLTPSESRLACALAAGKSIDEAVVDIGVSVGTARTYLKRIFAKTETRRQAELVKVILTSPNGLKIGGLKS